MLRQILATNSDAMTTTEKALESSLSIVVGCDLFCKSLCYRSDSELEGRRIYIRREGLL